MTTNARPQTSESSHNFYWQRFKPALQRFNEKYAVEPESGCWIWRGTVQWDNYGRFWLLNRNMPAHRASWILHKGGIPEGYLVLHKCDNHRCVNPEHLFIGTYKDNTQDMIRKRRDIKCRQSRRGMNSNFVKITPEIALRIFNGKKNQRITAKEFGITQTAVSLIRRGVNWSWLTQKGAQL